MRALILLMFFFFSGDVLGCSCDPQFFCELVNSPDTDTIVAFKAVVLNSSQVSDDRTIAELKMIKAYRDDFGMTDTIRIHGGISGASCEINIALALSQDDTVLIAILDPEIPDDLIPNPGFSAIKVWSCGTLIIRDRGDYYQGPISAIPLNNRYNGLYEYPVATFEDKIEDCSFTIEDFITDECSDENYLIYPNPLIGTEIKVKTKYNSYTFAELAIYALSTGQRVRYYANENNNYQWRFDLNGLARGIYVVRIKCGDEYFNRKFVVN